MKTWTIYCSQNNNFSEALIHLSQSGHAVSHCQLPIWVQIRWVMWRWSAITQLVWLVCRTLSWTLVILPFQILPLVPHLNHSLVAMDWCYPILSNNLLGLWCFAVESILHCYLFSDNTCKCAQQNAGDTFMFPRTASALGWTKPHCFGPEDCDSPQPLWNVPHTLPDPQCCDHLTSCSTACAAVCSELLLFTYFLFLFSFFCLLQMDKRGRNH